MNNQKWNVKAFLFENHEKGMTLRAYLYSFYYRYCVNHLPMEQLKGKLGTPCDAPPSEHNDAYLSYAKLVAFHVNRVTKHMPWEKKCLVRALTIKHFLDREKIPCTIYLGVGKEDEKMCAHAWLAVCGIVLSGADVDYRKFSVVAKLYNLGGVA